MKKMTKIWIAVATLLLILGIALFVGVMAHYGFDFNKLSTIKYEENTYDIYEEFDKISINVDTTDIEFVPTVDSSCKVICYDSEKVKHSVTVQNKTMSVDIEDTRKWYEHIGIYSASPKMTVHLPQKEYESLFIKNDTGDIKVECFTASEIIIDSATGTIELSNVNCLELQLENNTGDINLKKVIAKNSFDIENDTGDIVFENCDAYEIFAKTDTGNVSGVLLSDKIFITETSTGDISVPKTLTGGKCEIKTATGDITIRIKN